MFGFALSASGMMICQFLSLVVQPVGIGNPGVQTYHFATGMMDSDVSSGCTAECLYCEHMGTGDRFPFPVVEAEETRVEPSARGVPWWAKWGRWVRELAIARRTSWFRSWERLWRNLERQLTRGRQASSFEAEL